MSGPENRTSEIGSRESELERPDLLSTLSNTALFDPLSPVTRAERKLLLMISLLCLGLTWADLLPTRIEALGIEVTPADRVNIVMLLGLTLLYFLVAFVSYAAPDLSRWRVEWDVTRRRVGDAVQPFADRLRRSRLKVEDMGELNIMSHVSSDVRKHQSALRRASFRALFDFTVAPMIAGVAVLSVLAEFVGFEDPIDLLGFAWKAAPVGCASTLALLGLLAALIVSRYRGGVYRSPLRMRVAHRVIETAKLFPFSKRIQRGLLSLGLSIIRSPKTESGWLRRGSPRR